MKNFRFDEIWLLSEKSGTARHLKWSKGKNALVGRNHTGKSTVLRMMYEAFGCNTRPLGTEWDRRSVTVVSFTLGSAKYHMLRRDSMFALFRRDGELVWAVDDAGELRTRFSELFQFVLPLTNQKGDSKQARPAFFFVPYFIDQDGGWNASWQTFQNLGEFREWQRPTIELALGIRPSEYWQKQAEIATAKKVAVEIEAQQKTFDGARERLSKRLPKVPWFKDALSFRKEIKELEERAGTLAQEQDRLRNLCTELASERDALRAQVLLIDDALNSHSADMRFLDTKQVGEAVVCPTCGTEHEHSFSARLNLEAEADELRELRILLAGKLSRAEAKLNSQREKLDAVQKQCAEMEVLLSRTRGDLTLRGILDKVGVERAHAAFEEQLKAINESRGAQDLLIRDLAAQLKALSDPKRVKKIKTKFDDLYNRFAAELEVPPSLVTRSGDIQIKPRQGGSGGPRAILAYYYALAHIASEFSNGYLPPLVIDSPHANAQDEINRPRVTEFIFRNRVDGQQLIVGLEDPPPQTVSLNAPDDARHDLKLKFGLLQKSEYKMVLEFVEPLARHAVASLGKTLF